MNRTLSELGFWVAVGLVAVASVALFRFGAAGSIGDKVPGYRALAEFV
jgi:hypothetical protein